MSISTLAVTSEELQELQHEMPRIAREFGWNGDDLWVHTLTEELAEFPEAAQGKYHLLSAVVDRLRLDYYTKNNSLGGRRITARYDIDSGPSPMRVLSRLTPQFEFVHGGELATIRLCSNTTEFIDIRGIRRLQFAACGNANPQLAANASKLLDDLFGYKLHVDDALNRYHSLSKKPGARYYEIQVQ